MAAWAPDGYIRGLCSHNHRSPSPFARARTSFPPGCLPGPPHRYHLANRPVEPPPHPPRRHTVSPGRLSPRRKMVLDQMLNGPFASSLNLAPVERQSFLITVSLRLAEVYK